MSIQRQADVQPSLVAVVEVGTALRRSNIESNFVVVIANTPPAFLGPTTARQTKRYFRFIATGLAVCH